MPNPLSVDLRQRAVDAYQAGEGTIKEIASRFNVSPASLGRWLKLFRETGSLQPLPHSGGIAHKKILDEHVQALKLWLKHEPDLYLYEMADKIKEEFDITIDPSQLCRILQREQLSLKKK